jgi:hypothetical protein
MRRTPTTQEDEDIARQVINTLRSTLSAFPHQWEGREQHIRITVERKDATWISSLLYEECDRGLVNVRINVTPSPQSIEMEIIVVVLSAVSAELAKRGLDSLIRKVRERLNRRIRDKESDLGESSD